MLENVHRHHVRKRDAMTRSGCDRTSAIFEKYYVAAAAVVVISVCIYVHGGANISHPFHWHISKAHTWWLCQAHDCECIHNIK